MMGDGADVTGGWSCCGCGLTGWRQFLFGLIAAGYLQAFAVFLLNDTEDEDGVQGGKSRHTLTPPFPRLMLLFLGGCFSFPSQCTVLLIMTQWLLL